MLENYNLVFKILQKISKIEIAEKAADLWVSFGNPDSYNRNYLILFSKWAERELNSKNPEIRFGTSIDDPLHPIDIVNDLTDEDIIDNIARTEKMNEIKQFGAWAEKAVKMMASGFSFFEISKKLKIKQTELIQRLEGIARGRGQLALSFGGKND